MRVAGDELDESIINYMKRAYNLMVGERTAEEIKIKIGSAYKMEKETTMEVKGRDLVAGLPKTITISSQEVREALAGAHLHHRGLGAHHLGTLPARAFRGSGGSRPGAGRWRRTAPRPRQTVRRRKPACSVHVAEDPLSAVAEGTGKALQELNSSRRVASNDRQLHHHREKPAMADNPAGSE